MPSGKITKEQAKRLILMKQGLFGKHRFSGKAGIMKFIDQAGCIQFDPVDVCGKNHELVLQSRINGFRSQQLEELLYIDRRLVELYDKNMCILRMDDWPYFEKNRMRQIVRLGNRRELDEIADEILEQIRARGPVCSADLDYGKKIDWFWAPATTARAVLDLLYYRGSLVVHHRKNTRKYYDLASRNISGGVLSKGDPNKTDEERFEWHVLRRINSVGMLWNRSSDAFLGIRDMKTAQRNRAFDGLLSRGLVKEVRVEEIDRELYIDSGNLELLNFACAPGLESNRTEFIAPLDNMLWDRNLVREIFDFDYKWEIYTPPKDRKYGYYTVPVLYGSDFVGRIEIFRRKNTGEPYMNNYWPEDGQKETSSLCDSIGKCLARLGDMHAQGNV